MKKISKTDLFLKLVNPDSNGITRWVSKEEFSGEYQTLRFNNGADWCRKESKLAKKYNIEFDRSLTNGNGIDRIRLNGFNLNNSIGNQTIRSDIKNYYKKLRCVILNTSNPEIDHKNGRKNDPIALNVKTQTLDHFQPLSKAANDAKRQFCKECKSTNNRFDAKKLGYPLSFYNGNISHNNRTDGCVGCFWYDPIKFRKEVIIYIKENTKK
jgi:hypothetical protein